MAKLSPGDRVAFTAKFLKNTGQFTGDVPRWRATYVGPCPHLGAEFARVRWNHIDYTTYTDNYGEDHWREIRKLGSVVNMHNITRVGSPRFALNDL